MGIKQKLPRIFLLFFSLFTFTLAVGRPRGVSLEKASFYEGGTQFKCLSNGKVIPMDHVNDDYCDCEDGSDEPGTNACPNGLFYCENKPYTGSYISTSRVNDGFCDCCDGSDEFDGTIKCENTCEKLFAEIRAQQEAFRQKAEAGYKVKQEYIQQGKRQKDEKVARLSELEAAKDTLLAARNGAEEGKRRAEEPEKEAKDKHEAAWNAVKEEKKKAEESVVAKLAFAELDVNKDGIVDTPEIQNHMEFDIDSDGTVSDEEAKEYLEDSEECNLETFVEKIWPNIKEIYKEPTPEDSEAEAPTSAAPAEPEKKEEAKAAKSEEQMPDYDERTKALIAAADEARNKFKEAEKQVQDLEGEINDLKTYMTLDFGPDQEFAALKGQCFEYQDREYIYTLCPFDKTTQRPIKAGGMETSLGKWGQWYGPKEDKFSAMKYENGQGCWNGPARSCHVNFHCGSENKLTGASEPSRCEYQFEFTTPARCAAPESIPTHGVHTEL